VERIVGGPLATQVDAVKLNHVYIWAGAQAEMLIDVPLGETPDLRIETVTQFLDQLQACIFHEIAEKQENNYIRYGSGQTRMPSLSLPEFWSCTKSASFPIALNLIADRLIHGSRDPTCKRKLMDKNKTVTTKECLKVLQQNKTLSRTMSRMSATHSETVVAAYSDPTRRSQVNARRPRLVVSLVW
jgi:hypothetical protein